MTSVQPESGTTPAVSSEDPLRDVDSAALALAGLAGAVVLFTGDGDWDAIGTIAGLTIMLIVLAFHRAVHPSHPATRRAWLLRLAFGAVLALGFAAAIAWPVQSWIRMNADHLPVAQVDPPEAANNVVAIVSPFVAAVIAWKEERISEWIDPQRGPRREGGPGEGRAQ